MNSGPFTEAIKAGICPGCMGRGVVGDMTICLHEPPLCAPGDPCHMCQGSGKWPPAVGEEDNVVPHAAREILRRAADAADD